MIKINDMKLMRISTFLLVILIIITTIFSGERPNRPKFRENIRNNTIMPIPATNITSSIIVATFGIDHHNCAKATRKPPTNAPPPTIPIAGVTSLRATHTTRVAITPKIDPIIKERSTICILIYHPI